MQVTRLRGLPLGLLGVAFLLASYMVWADSGPLHQNEQGRPIQLGVSGGSIDHFDQPHCCGGTLGALVEDPNETKYVLGANHILARVNRGVVGEGIIQPALIDQTPVCGADAGDIVANLSDFIPIDFSGLNFVDAAIAEVRADCTSNCVNTTGMILDIGLPSDQTQRAYVGLNVRKSGATSGDTTGTVAAINVTANVQYNLRCGKGPKKVATFVDQFRISGGGFSAPGDSGAVVFEDVVGDCPKYVGLVFAGSDSTTLANQFDRVQDAAWGGGVILTGVGVGEPTCPECETTEMGLCNDSLDNDCDGLLDCDDSDCAGACGVAVCGDLTCDPGEDQCSCSGDCGAPPANETGLCTDGINNDCDGQTDCDDGDCSSDPACTLGVCGNGICEGSMENCTTCPQDCRCSGKNCGKGCCGDGQCTGNENSRNCPVDCDLPLGSGVGPAAGSPGRIGLTIAQASATKRLHSAQLFGVPDVVGHGIGLSADGSPVIEVYLARENAEARRQIPPALQAVETHIVVTGPFVAN